MVHHSLTQYDYAMHKYDLFKNIIKQTPNIRLGTGSGKSPNGSILFSTVINQDIADIGKEIYKWNDITNKNIKIIPENLVEKITERGLAYWFMDDASKITTIYESKLGYSTKFILATNNCTSTELDIIKQMFLDKWNLKFNFHIAKKDILGNPIQWITYFPVNTHNEIITLVKPYIIDSMKYKFELGKGKF